MEAHTARVDGQASNSVAEIDAEIGAVRPVTGAEFGAVGDVTGAGNGAGRQSTRDTGWHAGARGMAGSAAVGGRRVREGGERGASQVFDVARETATLTREGTRGHTKAGRTGRKDRRAGAGGRDGRRRESNPQPPLYKGTGTELLTFANTTVYVHITLKGTTRVRLR